jgi:hypothetical protein
MQTLTPHDDITVIIQGPLNESSLSNIPNYQKTAKNIIVSAWDTYDNNTKEYLPEDPNVLFITSDSNWVENWRGRYYNNSNIAFQIITTLNGLDKVKTKYVIKVRSDEIYTDIGQFAETMKANKEKLITNNVLFQSDDHEKFHPSDHVIGGTTNNMLGTFEKLENYCAKYAERGTISLTGKELGVDGLKGISSETLMCICFLQHKGVEINIDNSKKIMLSNFGIVPTEKMGRYMVMVKGKPYLKMPEQHNDDGCLLDWAGYVDGITENWIFPIESLEEL